MKTKIITAIFFTIILSACESFVSDDKKDESAENKITIEHAKVQPKQGILLFIESQPVKDYEKLGKVSNEPYVDQLEASNKNKKPLRALLDMGVTTFKNLSYNEKLNMLVNNAIAQYKDTVQGIIISDNLMSCEAIKFK